MVTLLVFLFKKMTKSQGKEYFKSFYIIAVLTYVVFVTLFVCIGFFVLRWRLSYESLFISIIGGLIVSTVFTYVYFLPYLIANKRKHVQTKAIYILNIFASWTIIAWIIAVIWANTESKANTVMQIPQSSADELKKYKALLDEGIITQDEFEAKKNQLLNMR